MPSKSKTRASARKKTTEPLPYGILAIAALMDDTLATAAWQEALETARLHLREIPGEDNTEMLTRVGNAAVSGTYKNEINKALSADPGNLMGGLLNGIGEPALRVGVCLAYVVLTNEHGGAR